MWLIIATNRPKCDGRNVEIESMCRLPNGINLKHRFRSWTWKGNRYFYSNFHWRPRGAELDFLSAFPRFSVRTLQRISTAELFRYINTVKITRENKIERINERNELLTAHKFIFNYPHTNFSQGKKLTLIFFISSFLYNCKFALFSNFATQSNLCLFVKTRLEKDNMFL